MPKHGDQYWEIDHYPVQYVDIENQCCFGVTDPLDIDNLVPSCGYCNKSHNFEKNILIVVVLKVVNVLVKK